VVPDPPRSIRLLPGWLFVILRLVQRLLGAGAGATFLVDPEALVTEATQLQETATPTIHRDIDDHRRHSGLAFTGVAHSPDLSCL
jgi:hypothetical protein